MGTWECSKCLEDNDDSEEKCQWCDTLRDEADQVRIRERECKKCESKKAEAYGDRGPCEGPDVEAIKAAWAARKHRLLQQLAEVDFCAAEERRSRLRALQLELHPDKHQQGHQQFAQEMFLLVQSRWEEDERSRRRRQEEAQRAEERAREEQKRAEERAKAMKREEAARAKEEALRRQKEAEEAEQKERLDAAMAAAREEDARRQEEEETAKEGEQGAAEDEGVQLDEDDSEEVSPADCVAEQHLVNARRRSQEEQLRKDLRTKVADTETGKAKPISVNISDIQGPLRTIIAETSWLVADVKKVLERTDKIHRGRQRLLLGDGDVDDLQSVADLAHAGSLNLVLVVCMDKHFRIDLFMDAFQGSWRVLQFASAAIRANPKIIKLALQKDWRSLAFAAPSLRTDYRMARLAVKRSGLALEVLTPEMRNDRGLVLMAVQEDWQALKFASLRLRGDKGVVIEAVRQSAAALEFASHKLRADRGLMLLAVKGDGGALRFASSKLQADVELVIEALRQDGKAIMHAAPEVRTDPKLHAAMKGNSEVLRFLGFDSRDRLSTEQELFDTYMGTWTSPYDDTIAAVLRRHR